MIYGYVRVSTKDQHTDRQMDAMAAYGVMAKNIYADRQSGKDFERPAYRRLLRRLKQGDILVIKSIDRLGRNYDEILEQWRLITREKGVDIRVLDMPLLNTSDEEAGVTRVFIADLVLQILAYVAQTEREFILTRQKEGIASAKARGVRFGRPEVDIPDNFGDVYAQLKDKEISGREAARMLGVDPKTLRKWTKSEEIMKKVHLFPGCENAFASWNMLLRQNDRSRSIFYHLSHEFHFNFISISFPS